MDDTTVVPLLNMIFKLRAVLGFGTVLLPCLVCNGQLRILGQILQLVFNYQDDSSKF